MELDRKNVLLILLLIVLAGSALRIYNLGAASIRADEGGTIYFAERPVQELVNIFHPYYDVQPPLFYSILHFWIQAFGKTAFALRLLPALLSIIAIPIIYLLGKELFNDKIGLFAALIFAISQANIRFAQTLRMYPLLILFALLSVYFLMQYFKNPSHRNFALYILFAVLSVYTHYFAGFLLGAEFLFAILFYKKYGIKFSKIFPMFAISAILSAPAGWLLYHQLAIKTYTEVVYFGDDPLAKVTLLAPNQSNIFARLGLIFYQLSVGFLQFNLKSRLFLVVFISSIVVFSLSLIAGIKHMYYIRREKLWLLLLSVAVPPICLALLWSLPLNNGHTLIPVLTYTRYLLFISPFYYLLVAYGALEGIPQLVRNIKLQKAAFAIILLAIVFFNAVSLNYYYTLDSKQENWDALSSEISKDYSQGEPIFLMSASYFYNFEQVFNNGANVYSVPTNLLLNNATFADAYRSIGVIDESNSCDALKILNETTNSVWFIDAPITFKSKPAGMIKDCFLKNGFSAGRVIESSYFNQKGENITDMRVYRFEK